MLAMRKGTSMSLFSILLLAGCATSQYQGYTYQPRSVAQNTSYRTQPVQYVSSPAANQQVATTSYSATSRTAVSSTFSKKLSAMRSKQAAAEEASRKAAAEQAARERERRINEFLWKNEIPGLSDTRILLKNTIVEADRKLVALAKDLRLAGKSPSSDPTYIEIYNKRNRVRANLKALDDKIMGAIVSKSAGSAAETLTLSADEAGEVAAARQNLQSAATQYRAETENLIKSTNW